jgi:hypothetical protein
MRKTDRPELAVASTMTPDSLSVKRIRRQHVAGFTRTLEKEEV